MCAEKATIYFGFSLREALQILNEKISIHSKKCQVMREGMPWIIWNLCKPVDTIALSCRWGAIIEYVAKMSITNCTKNFLTGHEDYRQVQLWLHIVSYWLIVRGPSSSAIKFSGWSRTWCTRLTHVYKIEVIGKTSEINCYLITKI